MTHLKKIALSELRERLKKHQQWLDDATTPGAERLVLEDVDLSEHPSALAGVRLERCQFHRVSLAKVDLKGADFSDAILHDVQFQEARSLLPSQLAGADLRGSEFAEGFDEEEGVSHIGTLAANSRAAFITLLAACTYALLTIATTTDARLISNSATSTLPIINAKISIISFYYFAPLILMFLYTNFLLSLQRLWRVLSKAPAVFRTGVEIRDKVNFWLLDGLISTRLPRLKTPEPLNSRIQIIVATIVLWFSIPVTLLSFWLRSLPRREFMGTAFHVLLVVISIALALYSLHWLHLAFLRRPPKPKPSVTSGVLLGCFFVVVWWLCALIFFQLGYVQRLYFVASLTIGGFLLLLIVLLSALKTAVLEWLQSKKNPLFAAMLDVHALRYSCVAFVLLLLAFISFMGFKGERQLPFALSEVKASRPKPKQAVSCTTQFKSPKIPRHCKFAKVRLPSYFYESLFQLPLRLIAGIEVQANFIEKRVSVPQGKGTERVETLQRILGAMLRTNELPWLLGRGAFLALADLRGANLFGADLRGANLRKARLLHANLTCADLRGADLRGAIFRHDRNDAAATKERKKTTLTDTLLAGAIYDSKTLWPLDFNPHTKCALGPGSVLENEKLGEMVPRHLTKLDLRRAQLKGADLRKADLKGADLTGANLKQADLRGVDLRQTKLANVAFRLTLYDKQTRWDPIFFREHRGKGLLGPRAHLGIRNPKVLADRLSALFPTSKTLTQDAVCMAAVYARKALDLSGAMLLPTDLDNPQEPKDQGAQLTVQRKVLKIQKVQLPWSDLRGIRLGIETQIIQANLCRAKLQRADLLEVTFCGVDLRGADFAGASLPVALEEPCAGKQQNRHFFPPTAHSEVAKLRKKLPRQRHVLHTKASFRAFVDRHFRECFPPTMTDSFRRELRSRLRPYHIRSIGPYSLYPRADLSGTQMHSRSLSHICLFGADLKKAQLQFSNLRGAILRNAKLRQSDLSFANLSGADLTDAKADGVDLSFAQLDGAQLRSASLNQAILKDASLRKADLYLARLNGANLSGADLQAADLRRAHLHGADLRRADLRGALLLRARLQRANLSHADLRRANLAGAILHRSNLFKADFRKANLQKARLLRAKLEETRFQGAVLLGSIFTHARLAEYSSPAMFKGAISNADTQWPVELKMDDVTLRRSQLQGINLKGARLQEVEFRGAQLKGADLRGSKLRNSDLEKADLSGADLQNADLTSADLSSADLQGADLRGATLKHAVLRGAVYNDKTLWPQGFRIPKKQLIKKPLKVAWYLSFPRKLKRRGVLEGVRLAKQEPKAWTHCPVPPLLQKFGLKGSNASPKGPSKTCAITFEALPTIRLNGARGTTLKGSVFNRGRFSKSTFQGALLQVEFQTATFTEITFAKAQLTEITFAKAQLTESTFAGAQLTRISFDHSTLKQVAFRALRSPATMLSFFKAKLKGVDFRGAKIHHSLFWVDSYDRKTSFKGADLKHSLMRYSSLKKAGLLGEIRLRKCYPASQAMACFNWLHRGAQYEEWRQRDLEDKDLPQASTRRPKGCTDGLRGPIVAVGDAKKVPFCQSGK